MLTLKFGNNPGDIHDNRKTFSGGCDRRSFILQAGSMAAVAVLSGATALTGHALQAPQIPAAVVNELAEFAHPRFAQFATSTSPAALYASLSQKGVISAEGSLQREQLVALAQQENLIVYDSFYYTPSELELYSLAWLLNPVQSL